MHLYLRSSRSSTYAPRLSTNWAAGFDTTHSAEIFCLITARPPCSRPPARCLPHSRRRLLPIAPEIHSPVASSSPSNSRISARQTRPTGPEGTHSASESQSQGSGPSADQAFGPLASALSFPVLPHPLHRLGASAPPSPSSAHPGRQQAPGLGTVPEPASGLRAARTTRYGRRRTHSRSSTASNRT